VTQLFPGIALGLAFPWLRAGPVVAGLLAGEASVIFLAATGRDPYLGMNAGFVALAVNFVVTLLAAWTGKKSEDRRQETQVRRQKIEGI